MSQTTTAAYRLRTEARRRISRLQRFERGELLVPVLVLALELLNYRLNEVFFLRIPQEAAIAYIALGVLALLWRHRAPITVFCAVVVHHLLTAPLFHGEFFTDDYRPWIGVLVALAAVSAAVPLAGSLTVWAATFAVFLFPGESETWSEWNIMFITSITGCAWGFGRFAGRNLRRISDLQQEQQREIRALDDERARIARELHDIVAHAVTVMVLHAAGGRRVVDSDPDRAAQALTVIEDTGSQAMQELHRLLGLLREAADDTAENLQASAKLSDADRLVHTVRGTGANISLSVSGQSRPLDASVDLAAYRVLQESLTNATKHGGVDATVKVTVSWGEADVVLRVQNNGGRVQRDKSTGTGYGLIGLKERVSIAGGDITYGPTGAGYVLSARLPIAAAARDDDVFGDAIG